MRSRSSTTAKPSANSTSCSGTTDHLRNSASLFARLSEPTWATIWATEWDLAHRPAVVPPRNLCTSLWARLGSNQRPLACEAIPHCLSFGGKYVHKPRLCGLARLLEILPICVQIRWV